MVAIRIMRIKDQNQARPDADLSGVDGARLMDISSPMVVGGQPASATHFALGGWNLDTGGELGVR